MMNRFRIVTVLRGLRAHRQAHGAPCCMLDHHHRHYYQQHKGGGASGGASGGLLKECRVNSTIGHCRWQSSGPHSPVLAMGLPNLFAVDVSSSMDEALDPFALVAEELDLLATRMREMVKAEVPKLATAAEYFFKLGAEGKRFRPAVLLLMATSVNVHPNDLHVIDPTPSPLPSSPFLSSSPSSCSPSSSSSSSSCVDERRARQRRLAEITEMIHVASLLHDDVLDHASTRRGVGSLNYMMGNKLAVLAGDFLLARASMALASLRNVEVILLLSKVLEDLVTGETMQMTADAKDCGSMEYYMKKTFFKTASLIAHSCKAITLLGGQPESIASLAYEYGRHLGLAFQLIDDALDFTGTSLALGKPALNDLAQGIATAPVLFAAEEFPRMNELICRRFKRQGDVEWALELVQMSNGIERTRELAEQHAFAAAASLDRLPHTTSQHILTSRRALALLTQRVLARTK